MSKASYILNFLPKMSRFTHFFAGKIEKTWNLIGVKDLTNAKSGWFFGTHLLTDTLTFKHKYAKLFAQSARRIWYCSFIFGLGLAIEKSFFKNMYLMIWCSRRRLSAEEQIEHCLHWLYVNMKIEFEITQSSKWSSDILEQKFSYFQKPSFRGMDFV